MLLLEDNMSLQLIEHIGSKEVIGVCVFSYWLSLNTTWKSLIYKLGAQAGGLGFQFSNQCKKKIEAFKC